MQQSNVEYLIGYHTDICPDLCGLIYDFYVPLKISAQTQELNGIIKAFVIRYKASTEIRLKSNRSPILIMKFRCYFFGDLVLSHHTIKRRLERTYIKFGKSPRVSFICRQASYRQMIFYQYRQDQRNKRKNRCAE